jgi:hypothetical protein
MVRRFGILLLLSLCAVSCQKAATPAGPTEPPAKLTLANFEKIHEGMTLPEVEAILGPPGAKGTTDVKRPDGSIVKKEVQSASWFWGRVSSSGKGGQPREEAKRIVVHLKDGKVSSKEQVGLE